MGDLVPRSGHRGLENMCHLSQGFFLDNPFEAILHFDMKSYFILLLEKYMPVNITCLLPFCKQAFQFYKHLKVILCLICVFILNA